MNSKPIKIGIGMVDMVWGYAEAAACNYASYGRNDLDKKDNIVTGKLGEIAYCMANGIDLSELSFDTERKVDPGYDLVVDGVKIDVKTSKTTLGRLGRVHINPNYAHCDVYAIMAHDPVQNEYSHVLNIDRQMALRMAKCESGLWFLDFENDYDDLMLCWHVTDGN